MIGAIVLHACIGLGGAVCGLCGQKLCTHRRHALSLALLLVLIEAIVMVAMIDPTIN